MPRSSARGLKGKWPFLQQMKVFPPSYCCQIVLFTHETPTLGRRGPSDMVELLSIKLLELKDWQLQGRSSSRPLRGAPTQTMLGVMEKVVGLVAAPTVPVWSCPWCWNQAGGSELSTPPQHDHRHGTTHGTYIKIVWTWNWLWGVANSCRLLMN